VFSKYGDKTPLFDNMHITATFATSEPNSIEKVTRRAGKSMEMRESFSDPRTLFGRGHRSTSQSEQQRYILSEEDVRGLDDRKQFLFVNNTKPILADKIRYYEEPFFKARCGDYFHGVPAAYQQRPGAADLAGPATIDWKGVQAAEAALEGFAGVVVPPNRHAASGGASGGVGAHPGHLDPGDYLVAASVAGLRVGFDDDDGSLG
jgi:type IV secretion system protein VirD4